VRSVSLDVGDHEIVTIIGANGAGKTTLLNAIMGILPLKGRVTFAARMYCGLRSRIASRPASVWCRAPRTVQHHERRGQSAVARSGSPSGHGCGVRTGLHAVFRAEGTAANNWRNAVGGEQQMLAMGRRPDGAPRC